MISEKGVSTGKFSKHVKCSLNWFNDNSEIAERGAAICYLITTGKNTELLSLECERDGSEDIGDRRIEAFHGTGFAERFSDLKSFLQFITDRKINYWDLKVTIDGIKVEFTGKIYLESVLIIFPKEMDFNYRKFLEELELFSYSL